MICKSFVQVVLFVISSFFARANMNCFVNSNMFGFFMRPEYCLDNRIFLEAVGVEAPPLEPRAFVPSATKSSNFFPLRASQSFLTAFESGVAQASLTTFSTFWVVFF